MSGAFCCRSGVGWAKQHARVKRKAEKRLEALRQSKISKKSRLRAAEKLKTSKSH